MSKEMNPIFSVEALLEENSGLVDMSFMYTVRVTVSVTRRFLNDDALLGRRTHFGREFMSIATETFLVLHGVGILEEGNDLMVETTGEVVLLDGGPASDMKKFWHENDLLEHGTTITREVFLNDVAVLERSIGAMR